MSRALRWAGYSLLMAGACSNVTIPPPDTEVPVGSKPFELVAPAPPELADWTCPLGWAPERLLDETEVGFSICKPPPLPEDCPDGEMPVVGTSECQLIGDPCPDGAWPVGTPTRGVVLYVQAGASGGDGQSTATPLGSIAAAMAAAAEGAVIVLAKGTFVEDVVIDRSVTLWGACATGTIIQAATADEDGGTIEVVKPVALEVKNLKVTGDRRGIWIRSKGAPASITGVIVEGALRAGIRFSTNGVGSGATGTLTDVAIRDTRSRPSAGTGGVALAVEYGAHVTVARALLERSHETGAYVIDEGSLLVLTDVLVRDTEGRELDGLFGTGLAAQDGGELQGARCVLERNHEVGIIASNFVASAAAPKVKMEDVIIRDTKSQASDGKFGRGVVALDSGEVTLTRALLEGNRDTAAIAASSPMRPPSTLTLTDVVIRDTVAPDSEGEGDAGGQGVTAQNGATLNATRLVLYRNRDQGVFLSSDAKARLTDLVVQDTFSRDDDGLFGRGIHAQDRAELFVERALLERNHEVSIFAGLGVVKLGPPQVTLTDVLIRDTLSETGPADGGRGINIQGGATFVATRVRVERARELGLFAAQAGTTATLVDFAVSSTLERECVTTTCPKTGSGIGIASVDDAYVEATYFSVRNNPLCGVQVARGGTMDLHHGEIVDNLIGANVQTTDFDIERLQDDVLFDNDTNLDATSLPVPSVSLSGG